MRQGYSAIGGKYFEHFGYSSQVEFIHVVMQGIIRGVISNVAKVLKILFIGACRQASICYRMG